MLCLIRYQIALDVVSYNTCTVSTVSSDKNYSIACALPSE